MRYYTIKALIGTDGTETRDMRGFDSYNDALTRFYSDMSSNVNECSSILEMIIDSVGNHLKNEVWVAETTTED